MRLHDLIDLDDFFLYCIVCPPLRSSMLTKCHHLITGQASTGQLGVPCLDRGTLMVALVHLEARVTWMATRLKVTMWLLFLDHALTRT